MSELDEVKRIGRVPAFPVAMSSYNKPSDGMTLRQYAAIAAMQGILASAGTDLDGPKLVKAAVFAADALLAELAK